MTTTPTPLPSPRPSTMLPPTLTDPEACDACTLVPGSLQRVREMAALREQGWSLDEIALRYAVSRERVRQILRAHGGPGAQEIAEARRRRAEQLAEARIDELLALWRAGEGAGSAAGKLGLQAVACRSTIERFATDVDRAARRATMAGARGARTWSDRDILLALSSVAQRLGRVASAKEYAALSRELGYPSLATVLNRMGGWSKAVSAAGLRPAAATPARARGRRWTEEACWDALRRAVEELGEIPSVLGYERFAAGRTDLPSSATVRNRLGRWSSLATRLAAQRELSSHGPGYAQPSAGA
jgi:transposase